METFSIPHNYISGNNLGDELGGRIALTTKAKVLDKIVTPSSYSTDFDLS